ncbi:2115_t:CDS:2, partial [Cetraspora pellucida]
LLVNMEKLLDLNELMIKHILKVMLMNNKPIMKQFTYTGLDSSIYKAYINRVFTHTTHGGAPRREVIAWQLFSKKFPSDKVVTYKNLSENELQLLNSEIIQQS